MPKTTVYIDCALCSAKTGRHSSEDAESGEAAAEAEAVADAEAVFSGSYNFTKQGERNAENCRVEHSPKIAALFLAEHNKHRAHAQEVRP